MAEHSPIFSAKIDRKKIGYIKDGEAFDLLGCKRCNYNPNTGNLVELDSGRTVGHVSLAGYFVGSSWIADELFPQFVAKNSPTTSPDKPSTADPTGLVTTSPDKVVTVECIAVVISPHEAVTTDAIASATSLDEAVTTDPIASATSFDEANAADSTAPITPFDEPTAAAPAASFKAFSQESTAVEPAASSTTSLEDTAAPDYAVCGTSPADPAPAEQAENLLSIDIEGQINEMMRMTLAMKSVKPKSQTVKDVAMRMREHLAGLRRHRPRAGMVKMADLEKTMLVETNAPRLPQNPKRLHPRSLSPGILEPRRR
jgi:hypothetical protein